MNKSQLRPCISALIGLALLLPASAHSEEVRLSTAPFECKVGPVTKKFGGTPWRVYGCNDRHSVAMVTAVGSRAFPFIFIFYWDKNQYKLSGEGTGNKAMTDLAFRELSRFSTPEIEALLAAAGSSKTYLE
jgi:hypothetical protein